MKTLFFITALYVLVHGSHKQPCIDCSTADSNTQKGNPTKFTDTVTLNGKWFLQPVLPSDTAAGKTPVLQIDLASATFSGNTGCNSMRGGFQKTDSSLLFNKAIITTKMICTGYNEAAFLTSLQHTNRYKFEKGFLILMFDATELSRWARQPEKLPKTNKT